MRLEATGNSQNKLGMRLEATGNSRKHRRITAEASVADCQILSRLKSRVSASGGAVLQQRELIIKEGLIVVRAHTGLRKEAISMKPLGLTVLLLMVLASSVGCAGSAYNLATAYQQEASDGYCHKKLQPVGPTDLIRPTQTAGDYIDYYGPCSGPSLADQIEKQDALNSSDSAENTWMKVEVLTSC